jgi:hypothetical protein
MRKIAGICGYIAWGPAFVFGACVFLFNPDVKFGLWMIPVYMIFMLYIFITSIIKYPAHTKFNRSFIILFDLTMVVIVSILVCAVQYKEIGIISPSGEISHSPFDALYFSIVTWTTLGYGDFQPTPELRIWAACEALMGYIIMAFYIALSLSILNTLKQKE